MTLKKIDENTIHRLEVVEVIKKNVIDADIASLNKLKTLSVKEIRKAQRYLQKTSTIDKYQELIDEKIAELNGRKDDFDTLKVEK